MKKDKGILAIDIGTSSIRVTLMDLEGKEIGSVIEEAFSQDKFEAEPRITRLFSMMKKIGEGYPEVEIVRICASTLIGWIFVDKDGRALSPVYTFTDYREEEKKEFLDRFSGEEFYRRTGRAVNGELPIFKMMWLKANHKEAYEKTAWLLSFQGYINFRLTGQAFMDYTFAAFSGLYNVMEETWDAEITEAAGLEMKKLPSLCGADALIGELLPHIQESLSIGAAQVVCGTSDGSAAALGSGVKEAGKALDVMGTTDVFYIISNHPVFEKEARLSVHPHPLKGLWLVGGATGITGGALEWAVKKLRHGGVGYDELNRQMECVAPGSDGLKAVSAFSGERAPRWEERIRGGFVNLNLDHTFAHCCRALSEASAYLTKEICLLLEEEGLSASSVTAIGGGAKSDFILRLRSNVLGCEICVPEYLNATTRGCYALAMLSMGKEISEIRINPQKRKYRPEEAEAKQYQYLYKDYIAFYEHYKKIYEKERSI